MDFEDDHDHTVPAALNESVHVSWSHPRSWHGETVTIRIRTTRVRNGDTLQLKIRAAGIDPAFHTLPGGGDGPINITDNSLDFAYKIDWKGKPVPANSTQFEVIARLNELMIESAPSEPMSVDLVPPIFSY